MTAKPSILRAAENLVGEPVRDAVLVIIRRQWAIIAAVLSFGVGLGVGIAVGLKSPLDFALAGAFCGVGLQFGMIPRFLVRTEDALVLTSSKRLVARPKEVLRQIDPHTVFMESGAINRKVSIGGESYMMSRLFQTRFVALTHGLRQGERPPTPPGYTPYQP